MKLIKTLTLNTAVAGATIFGSLAGTAHAAGNANLSMAGGSHSVGSTFSVPIYVSSADPINVVTANFSYGPQLQFLGVGCGSAFGITAATSANSVSCGVNGGGSVSGSQLVASISFKALAGSGSAAVSIAPGSQVYGTDANNSDIWNGATNSAAISFYTPAPVAAATVTTPPPAAPQAKAAAPKRHKLQLTYTTRPSTKHGISAWVYAPVAALATLAGLAYIFRKDASVWTKSANKQIRKLAFVKG